MAMPTEQTQATRIHDHRIDWGSGTVSNAAVEPITLRPQSLAVLKLLVARPGELVTKTELMVSVWAGLAVTDDSLVQCVTEIRKALGDEQHLIVKTAPKRGYIFVPGAQENLPQSQVKSWTTSLAVAALVAIVAGVLWFNRAPPAEGNVPVIAVLPFDDMSADKSMAYLGNGVADDIITMLARSPDVQVLARNSSFEYRDKPTDLRKVGAALGADYVMEGSVRKDEGGRKLRIVAQLIDARSGQHVWANAFDKSGEDPWALQDEVTGLTIGALTGMGGLIKQDEYRKTWGKDTIGLSEYDYYVRCTDHILKFTPGDLEEAKRIAIEGLGKFPDSPLLRFKLGFTYDVRLSQGWSKDAPTDIAAGRKLALEGLAYPGLSPLEQWLGHWLAADMETFAGNFDEGMRHANITDTLSPNSAFTIGISLSNVALAAGDTGKAIDWADRALSLDRMSAYRQFYFMYKGWAQLVAGDYEEALATLKGAGCGCGVVPALRAIAAVRLGHMDDAKRHAADTIKLDPAFTAGNWRTVAMSRDKSSIDQQVADLVAAGLPEK